MFHSVRARLVISYLLVGLVAALGVGLVTYLIASSYFRGQEINYLTRNADEIALDVLRPGRDGRMAKRAELRLTRIE